MKPALCITLLLALLLSGCTRLIALEMVRAPNADAPAALRGDAPPEELHRLYVDRQLRIPVGPPDATLCVWITEPISAPEELELTTVHGRVEATLIRPPRPTTKPATRPTTKPATAPATRPKWTGGPPRGTVVLLPGITHDQALGPYVLYRQMLVHLGYRVIQPDLRGHGRSTGDWITYGANESHDLVQLLDALEREHLIAGNVGVIAVSYGSSVAIQWAGIDPRVSAMVLLEPFDSLRAVAPDSAATILGPWHIFFSDGDLQEAVDIAGQIAHFNPDTVRPIDAITHTKAHILLIHGRHDEMIPLAHSERLAAAAPDHTLLVPLNAGGHFDLWLTNFELIRTVTEIWFDQWLASKPIISPVPSEKSGNP